MGYRDPYSEEQIEVIVSLLGRGMRPSVIGRRLSGDWGKRASTIERKARRVREWYHRRVAGSDTVCTENETCYSDFDSSGDGGFVNMGLPTSIGYQAGHNVLAIPDIHAPAIHPGALDHCKRTCDRFECDKVVFLGDVADQYSISRWESSPDAMQGLAEIDATIEALQPWYDEFPEALVCIGNHDERLAKAARSAKLPTRTLKNLHTVYECPDGWEWGTSHVVDEVTYVHGTGGGEYPNNKAVRWARKRGMSCVIGHHHYSAGVTWESTRDDLPPRFGMACGCLIDHHHPYMEYAKDQGKPQLGCGVVLKGTEALYIPMGVQ